VREKIRIKSIINKRLRKNQKTGTVSNIVRLSQQSMHYYGNGVEN